MVIAGLSALSTIGAALRRLDRGVARHDLDHLGAARRERGLAGPHQAFDAPAGVAERLCRGVAEAPAGAHDENAVAHDSISGGT